MQPGSLIRWTYRVKMPDDIGVDRKGSPPPREKTWRRNSLKADSPFAIGPTRPRRCGVTRSALPSLSTSSESTALLLGGIGVGNAIQSYMAKKRDVIATFKCLGATSRLVLDVYLIQAFRLALIGIVIGLVLGAFAPVVIATLYQDALPIALAVEPHPVPLIVAALAGLLTMVLFVLWPLGKASRISPAVLMRAHLTEERERSALPFRYWFGGGGARAFVLAVAASEERLVTAAISVGILFAFVLLLGFGLLCSGSPPAFAWVPSRLPGDWP